MTKPIISKARAARLERYAKIKKEYEELIMGGGYKTAVIDYLVKAHGASSATIYRALREAE